LSDETGSTKFAVGEGFIRGALYVVYL